MRPIPDPPAERLWHLEGVRGLACIQVVTLHAAGCFLPGLDEGPAPAWMLAIRQSPLRLLYDGDLAVFLFFVLSGHVLAAPFRRAAGNPGGLLAGRLVRFAVPVLLAVSLGFAVARAAPNLAREAGALLGAGWLNGGLPAATLAGALRDALLNALVLGYRDLSALSPWLGDAIAPATDSLDPPLWTLSVEMQGSLLVLGLTQIERRAPGLLKGIIALTALLTLRSPLLCFLAGYLCAGPRSIRLPRLTLAATALAAYLGAEPLAEWCTTHALPMLPALAPGLLLRGWVAILIFPLLLHGPTLRRWLAAAPWRRAGALSFPLYLVHWPVMFGPGAAALLTIAPSLGPNAAGALAALSAILLALALAVPFARIDRAALELGRQIRETWPGQEIFNAAAQSRAR